MDKILSVNLREITLNEDLSVAKDFFSHGIQGSNCKGEEIFMFGSCTEFFLLRKEIQASKKYIFIGNMSQGR